MSVCTLSEGIVGATAIQHVEGMNQVHVAHAYRRARQVNLLHPAKQEPGQVQIANHEWMILLSVCDARTRHLIREAEAVSQQAAICPAGGIRMRMIFSKCKCQSGDSVTVT